MTQGDRSYGRAAAAALARVYQRGMTAAGQPLWSEQEVEALKRAWPDTQALRRALPRRTMAAIQRRGDKLGLGRRKRSHIWTCAQVIHLKKMWPVASRAELLAAFPWASWEDLTNKTQHLRRRGAPTLRRPKPRPAPTGDAVLDSLINRAHAANFSLRDIDAKAGTGRYFASGQFRRRTAWDCVYRAVDALGGELDADWRNLTAGYQP